MGSCLLLLHGCLRLELEGEASRGLERVGISESANALASGICGNEKVTAATDN